MKNRQGWKKVSEFAILACTIACILASCAPSHFTDTDSSPAQPAEEDSSEAQHETDNAEEKPSQSSEEDIYAYEEAPDEQTETSDKQDAGEQGAEHEKAPEIKSDALDVTDYLGRLEDFVNDAGAEATDGFYIWGNGPAYRKGGMSIGWDNGSSNFVRIDCNNDTDFCASGIMTGMDGKTAKTLAEQAGWKYFYDYSYTDDGDMSVYTYGKVFDGDAFMLSITFRNDIAESWGLTNFTEEEMDIRLMEALEKQIPEWKFAYLRYIGRKMDPEDYLYFSLAYIDEDDIPEIVGGGSSATGTDILNFCNGQVNTQHMSGEYGVNYIEHEGSICNSTGRMDTYYDEVFSLKDGVFHSEGYGIWSVHYDENENETREYHWNDAPVTEEEYMAARDSCFDFSRSVTPYDETMDYYAMLDWLSEIE